MFVCQLSGLLLLGFGTGLCWFCSGPCRGCGARLDGLPGLVIGGVLGPRVVAGMLGFAILHHPFDDEFLGVFEAVGAEYFLVGDPLR